MIRMLKILETFWLLIAVVFLVMAFIKLFEGDTHNAVIFYIFTAVGVFFWYLRRRRRKALEKDPNF